MVGKQWYLRLEDRVRLPIFSFQVCHCQVYFRVLTPIGAVPRKWDTVFDINCIAGRTGEDFLEHKIHCRFWAIPTCLQRTDPRVQHCAVRRQARHPRRCETLGLDLCSRIATIQQCATRHQLLSTKSTRLQHKRRYLLMAIWTTPLWYPKWQNSWRRSAIKLNLAISRDEDKRKKQGLPWEHFT